MESKQKKKDYPLPPHSLWSETVSFFPCVSGDILPLWNGTLPRQQRYQRLWTCYTVALSFFFCRHAGVEKHKIPTNRGLTKQILWGLRKHLARANLTKWVPWHQFSLSLVRPIHSVLLIDYTTNDSQPALRSHNRWAPPQPLFFFFHAGLSKWCLVLHIKILF